MTPRQLISTIVVCLIISSSVAAQTPATQELTKEQEALEQQKKLEELGFALLLEVAGDAQALKLPENRLRVLANIASLLWTRDQKRARALFADVTMAFNEFSNVTQAGSGDLRYANNAARQLRSEVLRLMAGRDVSMARDFLLATRQLSDGGGEDEERMEQELMVQIAASDPKAALQFGQELLAKGFSPQVLNIISQLQRTDRGSAVKLFSDAVSKLRTYDLLADRSGLNSAMTLFRLGSRPQTSMTMVNGQPVTEKKSDPLGDDHSLRELADIIGAAGLRAISRSNPMDQRASELARNALSRLQPILPDIEKYSPARAAALRARMNELRKGLDPSARAEQDFRALIGQGTADELLQAASSAPPGQRERFFQAASQRALSQGDFERARQIVNDNITDSRLRNALLTNIERQALMRSSDSAKLEGARQLLSQLRPEERASTLAQLAGSAFAKGDKKQALQFLEEARALINRAPDSSSAFNTHLQVARAYTLIEPAGGFEMIEPMIAQLNALISAAAVVDGFQDDSRNFRDGEFLIHSGSGQIGRLFQQTARQLASLARTDLDRAKAVADRFTHNETRVLARLSIAQALLSTPERRQP